MNNNKYKLVLLGLTSVLLTACAMDVTTTDSLALENGGAYRTEITSEGSAGLADFEGVTASNEMGIQDDVSTSGEGVKLDTKIVSTLTIESESKELDKDIGNLETKIHHLKGYVGSHNIETANNSREARMSIRVPKDKASELIEYISSNFSIVAESSETVDITDNYYDTESRIKNLESQEEQLRIMYGEAKEIEDMLLITDRLNEVTREKEDLTKGFMRMKERSSYSTIELNVKEVSDFTITETVNEPTGDKIMNALASSVSKLKNISIDALVFIANALPYIGLGALGVFIYSKYLKKYFDNSADHEADTANKDNLVNKDDSASKANPTNKSIEVDQEPEDNSDNNVN